MTNDPRALTAQEVLLDVMAKQNSLIDKAFKAEGTLLFEANVELAEIEHAFTYRMMDEDEMGDRVFLPRIEVECLLKTFRQVLTVAREYHDGAADLVG